MPQISNAKRQQHLALEAKGFQECRACGQVKPFDDFGFNARARSGRAAQCRPCKKRIFADWKASNSAHVKEYSKRWRDENPDKCTKYARTYRRNRWIDATLRMIRSKCLRTGLPYDLHDHRDTLVARHAKGRCEMTGMPFAATGDYIGRTWDSPSFDRIDANKGYTYDNVRLVIWLMNTAMGDWGEDKLEAVMRAWLDRRL